MNTMETWIQTMEHSMEHSMTIETSMKTMETSMKTMEKTTKMTMVLPPKDSTATRTAKTALKIAKELTTPLVDMKLFFSVESIDKL